MKTLLLATAAILVSGSAFAQQAPVNIGNYDASVQQQFDDNGEYQGSFTFGTPDTMTTASIADDSQMTLEERSEKIFEEKSGR